MMMAVSGDLRIFALMVDAKNYDRAVEVSGYGAMTLNRLTRGIYEALADSEHRTANRGGKF